MSDATPHPPAARTPSSDRQVLAIAGLTSAEETAYELLVDRHTAALTHLATAWRRPEPLVETLAALEANGLVTRSPSDPDTYRAVAPNAGLEDLLLSREQQLDEASRYAGQLAATYAARAAGQPPAELVEVVTGQRAVQRRLTQIQHTASEELSCLDKPPYLDQASASAAALECLARGVRCRTIYERASIELPGSFPQIARLAEAGEQARIIANLPMKLYLADRRLALLPLQRQPAAVEAAIIVHPCGLLDALAKLFDSLWQRALPLNLAPGYTQPATQQRHRRVDDERLIALLLSGLTDQAIAHQLGIGHRTVQRHVATLMDQLGAHTRFQAGVQAALRHQRGETS